MGPMFRVVVSRVPACGCRGGGLPRSLASSGRLRRLSGVLILVMLLAGCGSRGRGSPCLDGGSRCAAAEAPPGMRAALRGHRIQRYRWLQRPNRESGGPDVGLQADWQPIHQRR